MGPRTSFTGHLTGVLAKRENRDICFLRCFDSSLNVFVGSARDANTLQVKQMVFANMLGQSRAQ